MLNNVWFLVNDFCKKDGSINTHKLRNSTQYRESHRLLCTKHTTTYKFIINTIVSSLAAGRPIYVWPDIFLQGYFGRTMVNAVSGPYVPRITAPPLIFVYQSHWRSHKSTILPLILMSLLLLLLRSFPNLDQPIILLEVSILNQEWKQTLEAILKLEAAQYMMVVPIALWATSLLVVLLLLNQSLPHQMM